MVDRVDKANGNSWRPETLPGWARAMALVGIPGVLAFFFAWVGAQDIPRMARQVEQLQLEILYNRKVIEQQTARIEHLTRIAQTLCANQAKDNLERRQCFE